MSTAEISSHTPEDRLADLGTIHTTFRPNFANLIAGVILGLALIVGGIALATFLALRPDPKPIVETSDWVAKHLFIGGVGVLAPVGGIVLLIWMKRLLGHRVLAGENGLAYVYRGKAEACPWSEIAEIREIFTHESLKVLKVPGASIKNIDRSLIVKRKDGKEFRFTVNSIKGVSRLAALLKEASERRQIPWQIVEQ